MLTTIARAHTESERLYQIAQEHLAGGVSAAARIHAALGTPFVTARGQGARVWDADGRVYLDLNTSNGANPLLLGTATYDLLLRFLVGSLRFNSPGSATRVAGSGRGTRRDRR